MLDERELEAVHDCILNFVIEHETVPKAREVAELLDIPYKHVQRCVVALQHTGRLRKGQLYPLAYNSYFREHIAPKAWEAPRLAPLPKKGYKEMRKRRREAS